MIIVQESWILCARFITSISRFEWVSTKFELMQLLTQALQGIVIAVNELLQLFIRLSCSRIKTVDLPVVMSWPEGRIHKTSLKAAWSVIEKPTINSFHRKINFNRPKNLRLPPFSSQEFGQNIYHRYFLSGNFLTLQVYHDKIGNKSFWFFFPIKQRNGTNVYQHSNQIMYHNRQPALEEESTMW